MTSRIQLTCSPSGWGFARFPDGPTVRFRLGVIDETVVLRELHFASRDGVDSETLRRAPLARLVAALNKPELREQILQWERPEGAEALELASANSQVEGQAQEAMAKLTGSRPGDLADIGPEHLDRSTDLNELAERLSLRLRGAKTRTKPAGFYEQVASIYSEALEQSRSPAPKIARANGVPVSTVHRWVREARDRGLLPSGQRRSTDGEGS